MNDQNGDFTAKYSLKLKPALVLGVLAAVLLIFSPLFHAYVSVGLGIVLLLLQGLCHWPNKHCSYGAKADCIK